MSRYLFGVARPAETSLQLRALGSLVRLQRWNETLVGPVATQYDYSDYRDVADVKRPFKWVKTSTRNQVTMVIKEMRPNVAIDAAKFAKPTTTRLIK